MKEQKISIIIPLFNNEKYIKNCIESALNQNYKNIEIIVINDGSTDSSEKIVKNMKKENIKLINQENAGPSSARNNGIKNASGDWIIFLDSDDTLAENSISDLVKNSESSDCVIGGWNAVYPNGTKYFGPSENVKLEGVEIEKLGEYLLSCRAKKSNNKIDVGSIEGPVAKLYSTKIIKDNNILFPENLKYAEDVCFNYNYLQHCNSIVTINKVIYFASRHSDSLSNSQRKLMILKETFEKEIKKVNIKNWNIQENVIYRYIYWTLEDLERSSVSCYQEFEKEYKAAKKINFTVAEKKYLTKWKRIELKFLNYTEPISYVLFRIYELMKRLKMRLKYGK